MLVKNEIMREFEPNTVKFVKTNGKWSIHFLSEEEISNALPAVGSSDIQNVLLDIGIPANILGYAYIAYAEELILKNEEYLQSITKMLYVNIARKYFSTPSRVERAIRHAISVGWSHGNMDYINSLFHNSVNPRKGSPTNSQFLSRVYFYLKHKNDGWQIEED